MDRAPRSFRSRMVMLFGLSMIVAGILTYFVYKILQTYYHENVRYGDTAANWRDIIGRIGDLNFFLIVFIPLSFILFFLLTKPYASYFDRISAGIRSLAGGDFNTRVQVNSGDEFEAIAEDINKASEQLKTAIERGSFAESSKDQLVLNLAHDLRTPLTSVLGYLDLVLKNDGLSPDQVRHYTTIAFTKSRRLERLVEELFEVTRMSYGNLPIDKKPIDLAALLSQLVEELYPLFENNELAARLSADNEVMIEGDGELLARVFENLLANAARYGKDGKFIDIGCRLDGAEAVVQVINYGSIIPEEEQPHLFEMFYTGDKARTGQTDSTGLGLFIAKNIVNRHRGSISVRSDLIRTVFEVRLPR